MPSLEASLYSVSLLNDDKTPMEFVVGTKPVQIQALSSYAAASPLRSAPGNNNPDDDRIGPDDWNALIDRIEGKA